MKINLKKLLIIFIFIPFFKPIGLEYYEFINSIFKAWKLISICIIIFEIFQYKKIIIQKGIYGLMLFWSVYFLNNIINNNNLLNILINGSLSLLIILYINKIVKTGEAEVFLNALSLLFSIYTYIQILSMLYINITGNAIFQPIEGDYIYFLGTDNYSAFAILPMLIIIIYNNYLKEDKLFSAKNIIIILSSIGIYFYTNSVTAMISCLLLLFSLIIYKFKSKILKKIKFSNIILIFIATFVLIKEFNIQNLFVKFLTDGVGKDLTLNSRTIIWSGAAELISKKIWFGYGTLNEEIVNEYWLYGMSHTHNFLLEILLRTGIVGTVGFGYFISACFKNNFNSMVKSKSIILILGLISIMLLSFMDFYPTILYQYCLIGIIYNWQYFEMKEKN